MTKSFSKIWRITKQFLGDPEYKFCQFALLLVSSDRIPDRMWVKYMFHYVFGYPLNLRHPQTFNEKLNWLKLHDHNPLYAILVDKISVKQWMEERIGAEYIIPTLAVWKNVEDIDITDLPNQFVIKCNHDAGSTIICHDKTSFDLDAAKKQLRKSLNHNFYLKYREWAYKYVKPQILAEQYIVDFDTNDVLDYKFFVFHGQVKCFKIDFDRFTNHRANYYDTQKNLLPIGEKACPPAPERLIHMPSNLNSMISKAEQIGAYAPFMRVDMYNIKGRIYFSECTLYPAGGYGHFTDNYWDLQLGNWML